MRGLIVLSLAGLLAGCQPGGETESVNQTEVAEVEAPAPKATSADLTSAERGCPFRVTKGWYAQIENTRFSVDGQVDFLMAGFRPELKKKGAEGGTVALELSLAQAAGGAVEPAAHYEEALREPYRRVSILCGGKEVASFEPMDQRL